MLFSLNVGKVDAGVAVLLTEDMRVIEFPSILLPDGIKSGSIVDISVQRNRAAEASKEKDFRELQTSIWEAYGRHTPKAPVLRCRNTTQTAVVLEWDALELATAKLRSLSIYRNGEKMGNIPNPLSMTSTKISGLAVDREYTFQLELRTSSGLFRSELLRIHTHKMTELGGITVTPGVMAGEQRDALVRAIERIGGRIADTVRLDTTHFVCTEGRGKEWERAKEMNVPVVRPEWVEGCEQEGRMVGVKDYYLDANPKLRPMPQLSRQTSSGQNTGTGSAVASPAPSPQISRETQSRQSHSDAASTAGASTIAPSMAASTAATVTAAEKAKSGTDDDDDSETSSRPTTAKRGSDDDEADSKRNGHQALSDALPESPGWRKVDSDTAGGHDDDDDDDDDEEEEEEGGGDSTNFEEVAL